MEFKKCNLCKKTKKLDEFHKNKNKKDGINDICKECNKKKVRDWYEKNSERARKTVKKYREKNIEKYLKSGKEYYQKNKKKFKEYSKKRRGINVKKVIKRELFEEGFRKCSCCKEIKKLKEFGNEKRNKDGLRSCCKKCNNKKSKEWADDNRERVCKNSKRWASLNPEKCRKNSKKYREANKEKCNERNKEWRKKNPEKVKESNKKWAKENVEKKKRNRKEWINKNRERVRETRRKYKKRKFCTDPVYKLKENISSAINSRLRLRLSSKKGKSTFTFLPYTVDELKQHLENLFEPWMNWSNWGMGKGKWNIDHKIPDSSFDYKNVEDEEFQKCWALSNLRPLDAIENMEKGNKLIY